MCFSSVLYAQKENPMADGRSQIITDSLAEDFRSVVARNFSRYRTINMYWEMKSAHDYTFTADGKEIERGRKRDLHTIRLSTMIPLLKKRQFSLYATYNIPVMCSTPPKKSLQYFLIILTITTPAAFMHHILQRYSTVRSSCLPIFPLMVGMAVGESFKVAL